MTPLSLTGKRWVVRETSADGISIPEMLLARRKIGALGQGEIIEGVIGYDAHGFNDFEKAAARIEKAIKDEELIGIFGDYDCDGITATAIMGRFLKRHGNAPIMRLPHRQKEGYGLRKKTMDDFKESGVTLLITVDTGVTALEPITHANELGIDVIVLDHHHLPEILPPAFAILHQGLASPAPDAAPCAAGIAWSAVQAMEKNTWDDRETDIALAAIGTVADIVELRGENRSLTHAGLMALAQLRPERPLSMLCAHAGLESPYTSRDIGFRISPRINAAGRMADPHIALRGLLGDTHALLDLDRLNRERQDVVSGHLEELLPKAELVDGLLLGFSHDEYTPGICGLLAGRLCEMFGKPSLVAAVNGDLCTASLRSVPGYDITAGLHRCRDLLQSYGGHAMAAGCTFAFMHHDALLERLENDIAERVTLTDLVPTLIAECELPLQQCTLEFCETLAMLEPFGAGNPEPRFLLRNVNLQDARCVGATKTHLQGIVKGRKVIGFGLGHLHEHTGESLDLLCRIGVDTWRGGRMPQLFLDDARIAETVAVAA